MFSFNSHPVHKRHKGARSRPCLKVARHASVIGELVRMVISGRMDVVLVRAESLCGGLSIGLACGLPVIGSIL